MTTNQIGEISIDLVLGGKDQYERDLTSIENDTRQKTRRTGDILSKFGIGLAAGFGATVLKMADDLNKSFQTIQISTGAIGEDLESLESSLVRLTTATAHGPGDVADAIAALHTEFGTLDGDLEQQARLLLDIQLSLIHISEPTRPY